ncbi:hypothetical protein EVAR_48745_1 [Eumeta japonica]|uniref:Uncharacterized protein n=1 Tax=Eumeta variegata TaxID=151549 RepID=A0A4C1YL53_EUMVA|nr:hypothetical protein EVAR_48745_1 [Eumeta japonica]
MEATPPAQHVGSLSIAPTGSAIGLNNGLGMFIINAFLCRQVNRHLGHTASSLPHKRVDKDTKLDKRDKRDKQRGVRPPRVTPAGRTERGVNTPAYINRATLRVRPANDKATKAAFFKIRSVCSVSGVKAEQPRKRALPGQCHNCQSYGHSSRHRRSTRLCPVQTEGPYGQLPWMPAFGFASVDLPHPSIFRVQVRDGGLIVASCPGVSRRGHDPDGSGGNGPSLVDPLIDICRSPVADTPARGQAPAGEGAPRRSRRGEEAQLLDTQPTAGGRRWWTPTGSRRHASQPGQYVSASRVLQPLLLQPLSGVDPVPTLDHPRARVTAHALSVRWGTGCEEVVSEGGRRAEQAAHAADRRWSTLVDADRIKAARIGDPRWRRSNRARLPTADQAIHASDGGSQAVRAASRPSPLLRFDHHPSSTSSLLLRLVFGLPSFNPQATCARH